MEDLKDSDSEKNHFYGNSNHNTPVSSDNEEKNIKVFKTPKYTRDAQRRHRIKLGLKTEPIDENEESVQLTYEENGRIYKTPKYIREAVKKYYKSKPKPEFKPELCDVCGYEVKHMRIHVKSFRHIRNANKTM